MELMFWKIYILVIFNIPGPVRYFSKNITQSFNKFDSIGIRNAIYKTNFKCGVVRDIMLL